MSAERQPIQSEQIINLLAKENVMTHKSMLYLSVFALATALLLSGIRSSAFADDANKTQLTRQSVEAMIGSWPEKPREAATKLLAKYGPPNEATSSMLVWNNNGPWKRTILYRQEIPHSFPEPHTDFLQQTVDYRVPADKFDDLAKFDGSVIAERTKGEISARCDMEELNMLALNLADDVVTGKRSPEDARAFYAKTAMDFKKGKTEPYTSSLQFHPSADSKDPDQPAMMASR
jgi:hypothetical protein